MGAGGVEIAEFPRMTTVQRPPQLNPLLVTCCYQRLVSVHWVLSEVPIRSLPHSQTIQMCSICITCVIITYGTVSNIKQFNEFNSPDSFLQVRFSYACTTGTLDQSRSLESREYVYLKMIFMNIKCSKTQMFPVLVFCNALFSGN